MLEVPRRYRRVYGLAFGSVGGRNLGAAVVRLRPCPSSSALWMSWAGGYLARRPACMPLVVRSNRRAVRIRLSLGRRCPDS